MGWRALTTRPCCQCRVGEIVNGPATVVASNPGVAFPTEVQVRLAVEMVGYFYAAHPAFSTDHLGLARSAYRKLLDTLELDDEVETFSGHEPAILMLDASLHPTMFQYLHAVYETGIPDERAGELGRA